MPSHWLASVRLTLLVACVSACARDHSADRPPPETDDDPSQTPDEESASGEDSVPDATTLEGPDASANQLCGTRGVEPCPDGQYCLLGPECGRADEGGYCQTIPDGCARFWDPVCACDGKTYANEGCAAFALQSVVHTGACESDGIQLCDSCDIPDEMPQPLPCPDGTPAQFACVVTTRGGCEYQRLPCPPCDERPLQETECWTDTDCKLGTCIGASCCGPNGVCAEVDSPGRCREGGL